MWAFRLRDSVIQGEAKSTGRDCESELGLNRLCCCWAVNEDKDSGNPFISRRAEWTFGSENLHPLEASHASRQGSPQRPQASGNRRLWDYDLTPAWVHTQVLPAAKLFSSCVDRGCRHSRCSTPQCPNICSQLETTTELTFSTTQGPSLVPSQYFFFHPVPFPVCSSFQSLVPVSPHHFLLPLPNLHPPHSLQLVHPFLSAFLHMVSFRVSSLFSDSRWERDAVKRLRANAHV